MMPPCDCAPVVGAAWPCASDMDDGAAWVERCDDCAIFADDIEAAIEVSRATGWPLRWATIHGDPARPQPYVQPADLGVRPPWGIESPYPRNPETYYDPFRKERP